MTEREKTSVLSRIINVPTPNPGDARRRRLLNIMLLALAAGSLLMLVAAAVALPLGLAGEAGEVRLLYLGIASALLGVGVIYAINRYVSGKLGSTLFILLLIVIAATTDEPRRVMDGRGLFLFAIPILSASVLLPPWASFAAAGLSSFVNIFLAVGVERTIPNVPAIIGFFVLSLVAYLSARSLERALEDLHAANAALREGEKRYRGLFEGTPVGLYRATPEGQILDTNLALMAMLGYPDRQKLMERGTVNAYIDAGERGRWLSLMKLEGEVRGFEARWRRCDGTPIWVRESAHAVRDDVGKVLHIEGAVEDVTERVQAEEERKRLLAQIQEQAQQVQDIVNTVPEGVLLLDGAGKVILVNPVARRNLAVLAGAVVGDTLTHLADHPLSELLASPPGGLWHEIIADGQVFEVLARPMEEGLGTAGWVLVLRDVTQEREIQQRVQQQERLAAVGQLAAGIAHDFNNIMATITLYAQMTLRVEGLTARDRERVATINQQAMHASNLIQQILDFSRRSVLERQPFDLTPFLNEQVNLLERTLPESIKIDLVYGSDEYTINADPTRIQQGLMNLAINARDAMPEGGELNFEMDRLRIGERDPAPLPDMEAGEWVRLTVADTGRGIPSDVIPHIFEPFFTTKSIGKGTGLGLAQVWGIVRQHEGHIDVASIGGEGTTFTLYLPALPISRPEVPTQGTPSLARGHGETILVVEDNEPMREALVESLTLLNYQVLEAVNGLEALDVLGAREAEIALVLSDVVMPDMGGPALLHALKDRGWMGPVVMMTGHPLRDGGDDLRLKGVMEWLQKPVSLEELARGIEQALGENLSE